jgi:hypothetical protein
MDLKNGKMKLFIKNKNYILEIYKNFKFDKLIRIFENKLKHWGKKIISDFIFS